MSHFYRFIILVIVPLMVTSVQAYDMTLAWDPNSEADIAGYNLYVRDIDNGNYNIVDNINLDEINSEQPQFMITDMENDVTYYFVVTALNNAGLESNFSNEVVVLNGNEIALISTAEISSSNGASGSGCFISSTLCELWLR